MKSSQPSMDTQQVFSSEDSFANINGYQMIDLNRRFGELLSNTIYV